MTFHHSQLLKIIHNQSNQVIGINDGLQGDAPDHGLIGEDPDGAGGGLEHFQEGQGGTSGWVPNPTGFLCKVFKLVNFKSLRGKINTLQADISLSESLSTTKYRPESMFQQNLKVAWYCFL